MLLTIGQKLKQLRQAARKTVAKVAEDSGIKPQRVSFYEMDKGIPTIPILKKLAIGLECTIFDIIDETFERRQNGWIAFQESKIPITDLEMVKVCLLLHENNEQFLKWVVIAMHNATQNVMKLIVKGTASFSITETKKGIQPGSKKHYDDFQETHKKGKMPRMITFDELIDRLSSVDCNLSDEITENLKYFNKIRNNFEHSQTSSYSCNKIDIFILLENAIDTVRIIINNPQCRYKFSDSDFKKIDKLVKYIVNIVKIMNS